MFEPVIIITGTSRGIGKQLAEYYLSKDYFVIGCSRGESTIEESAMYKHYSMNVTDETSLKEMLYFLSTNSLTVTALINNAGIAKMNHCIATPLKSFKEVLETNILGTFLFSREIAKYMIANRTAGRIVNITSIASPLKLEGELAYATSKSGVEEMTKIMAKELASFNITVNAVGPTPTPTDLLHGVSESKLKNVINQQTIKRMGNIEDIKNVIDFFLNEKSEFITGQIIYLGGV